MLASAHYPEENAQWFSRDGRGNVIEKRIAAKPGSGYADVVSTASYPASCTNRKTCNRPDYVIDAKGNRTDFTWDTNHGGILTETRPAAPNGVRPQKRYTYTQLYAWIKNSSGSYVQAATPVWMLTGISECRTQASCVGTSDETKTTITYGTTGAANNLLPTVTTSSAGDNSVSATTTTTYDFTGNAITVDGPLAGSADTARTRYDAMRRVVGVVSPDPDGVGPLLHRATRNTFDLSGNLIKAERGTVTGQSDAEWAAFSSLEAVDTIYDIMGRKLKESKSGGGTVYAVTQYSYDSSGRLECTAFRMDPAQWNSQTNACAPQTSGPYGPDRVSRNVYNAAGERTVMKLGVGTSIEADDETTTYTLNGKLATITDGEGNKTTYTYDGHDRLYRTNFPDPFTDGASSATDFEQVAYDANGNVTQQRLRDGQLIGFSYDNLDRMTFKDLPGSEIDVTYSSYTLQGLIRQLSQGSSWSLEWNAFGRNTSETGPHGTMSYDYDSAGRRTRATWPDGFYVNYDYLVTGEVSALRENGATSGIGVLAAFGYDNLGGRTSVTRGNGATTSYTYDAISRLASLSHDLAGTAQDVASTFSYNPASQKITHTRNNDAYAWLGHYNVSRGYSINGLNQMTLAGATSIAYDGRGNLTTLGSASYSYTSENRLISGPGGASYQYDASGRLYQSIGLGLTTRFQYDSTDLVAEYNASNVMQRRFVHGPGDDEPIVWYEGAGTSDRRWFHQDERGSVIALSNSAGSSIATNTYDEYGLPAATNLGRFAYTGQTWMPEVGLYYYKARVYSPALGRFLQADPDEYDDGMNLYAYVQNDPIGLTDPTGTHSYLPPGSTPWAYSSAACNGDSGCLQSMAETYWDIGMAGLSIAPTPGAAYIWGARGGWVAIGSWVAVRESMKAARLAYQVSQGGRAGYAFVVNGVKFDSFVRGKLMFFADKLIEAKSGLASLVSKASGEFRVGGPKLLDQARRQIAAVAGKAKIEWRVDTKAAAEALKKLFKDAGITEIHVKVAAQAACTGTRLCP
jgi:RHS repeat-associated protein